MSEFKVEVVKVGPIEKHPNADRLEIVNVHGGYPCIIAKGSFKEGDLAIYCPIDSLVDVRKPEFAFLHPKPDRKTEMDVEWAARLRKWEADKSKPVKIKAKKLRGVFSMGLLIPTPAQDETLYPVGADMQEYLGIEKYEPDESNRHPGRGGGSTGPNSGTEKCPFLFPEYTDLDSIRKHSGAFEEGEMVTLTEKLHGCNARYVFHSESNRLWVGSRHQVKRAPRQITEAEVKKYQRDYKWWLWKKDFIHLCDRVAQLFGHYVNTPEAPRPPKDIPVSQWHQAAIYHDLEAKLSKPGMHDIIVMGEIYGPCQDLKYGSPDQVKFAAFDAYDLKKGRYLDYHVFKELMDAADIPTVPELYVGPWKPELKDLAEGQSTLPGANHVREGWVCKPLTENTMRGGARKILKYVGQNYLLR